MNRQIHNAGSQVPGHSRIAVILPTKEYESAAARKVIDSGVLRVQPGPASLLKIEFGRGQRNDVEDFRPHLRPVVRF